RHKITTRFQTVVRKFPTKKNREFFRPNKEYQRACQGRWKPSCQLASLMANAPMRPPSERSLKLATPNSLLNRIGNSVQAATAAALPQVDVMQPFTEILPSRQLSDRSARTISIRSAASRWLLATHRD